jgi:cytochrome c-type biogenesis protein CcmH/NrfF
MPATYALWFGPAVLFLLALLIVVRMVQRQRQDAGPAPLTDAEQAALARLANRGGQGAE